MARTELEIYESAQDLVALLDAESLQPLLPDDASPMRVTVRETSRLTRFQVEDSTIRTDHRVVDPVEINLPLLLAGPTVRSLYELLRTAWMEGRPLIMQTKVRSYDNLLVVDMPHDETPEQGDSIPVSVRLQELRTVAAVYGPLPASKTTGANGKVGQQDTKKRGQQQTSDTAASDAAKGRQASVLHGVFFG